MAERVFSAVCVIFAEWYGSTARHPPISLKGGINYDR